MTTPDTTVGSRLAGRLGDPSRDLATDPRADQRMVQALAQFGLDGLAAEVPVDRGSSPEELLAFAAAAEEGFEAVFAGLVEGLPPVNGVVSETRSISTSDGGSINLYIHRPDASASPLPAVVHLHGGGMAILGASGPCYTRWRDELAATGLVVVGVEFRNAGGVLGPHTFPAGLQDCADATRWAHEHAKELGISHLILSGESGGANLSLATTIKAKSEGWADEIAGVYAQCPYISGQWPKPTLPSHHENDRYFVSLATFAAMAEMYDPGGQESSNAQCWPLSAEQADLDGLPPHVLSMNELDPLRDEGLVYYGKLRDAGVEVRGRIVPGTCHGGDVFFRKAIPDVYESTIRDIRQFAEDVGR